MNYLTTLPEIEAIGLYRPMLFNEQYWKSEIRTGIHKCILTDSGVSCS
jgi:hypothetical protein